MIKIIALVSLLATPIYAREVCDNLGELAYTVATARDNGLPLETVIKIIDANNSKDVATMFGGIVESIYQSKNVSPAEHRYLLITACLQSDLR